MQTALGQVHKSIRHARWPSSSKAFTTATKGIRLLKHSDSKTPRQSFGSDVQT